MEVVATASFSFARFRGTKDDVAKKAGIRLDRPFWNVDFDDRDLLPKRVAGRSISAVRVHGVHVGRVRFPAARPIAVEDEGA